MEEKRKMIRPFEKLILVIGLSVLAYLILQKAGWRITDRTEKVEIIHRPKENLNRPIPKPDVEREAEVENVLKELAGQFSSAEATGTSQTAATNQISGDEHQFLQWVRTTNKMDGGGRSRADWLSILRASHQTYRKLRSVVAEISGQPVEKTDSGDLASILRQTTSAAQLYQSIADTFQLSSAEVAAFAERSRPELSEWAAFITTNQQ